MMFRKLNIHLAGRATHQALRDMNEVLVLNLVRERQPISRIDIAGWTGLEGSTVSKIVARLLESGFIYEDGVGSASPQGGRKKRFLRLNPEKVYAIGVDLEPHRIMVALSDFSGRILRSMAMDNEREPQRAVEVVARSIKKLLQSKQSKERVAGIGVSLVGLIDPKEGRILAGENLGWGDDVPVGSMLRSSLNMRSADLLRQRLAVGCARGDLVRQTRCATAAGPGLHRGRRWRGGWNRHSGAAISRLNARRRRVRAHFARPARADVQLRRARLPGSLCGGPRDARALCRTLSRRRDGGGGQKKVEY